MLVSIDFHVEYLQHNITIDWLHGFTGQHLIS